MGNKLTKAALKIADGITRRSTNMTCTWLFFQPRLSKETVSKLKKK